MRNPNTTYVGMDTSKSSIQIALLTSNAERPLEWEAVNDAQGIAKLIKKLKREGVDELRACYEAGPCGYGLQRAFRAAGIDCIVVAPSLVPMKPGDKIKTNRRDAKKLAVQFRAGALAEVAPPTPEEEAVRDVCRAREDIREDLLRARHRLGKMLLRRSLVYAGKAWTHAHSKWLKEIRFELQADRAVFDDYVRAISLLGDRLSAMEAKLGEIAQSEPWREPVGLLRCYRGIDTVTAISIIAEIHGFGRFESARHLMSYLGLVPSENSTGDGHRRGRITRTGNRHVRRLLVEAAWHYRHRPSIGAKLRKRREGQPGWAIAAADRAQERLHGRYIKLVLKGKAHNKVVTAVARELAGFIWATLYPSIGSSPVATDTRVLQGLDALKEARQEPQIAAHRRRTPKGA